MGMKSGIGRSYQVSGIRYQVPEKQVELLRLIPDARCLNLGTPYYCLRLPDGRTTNPNEVESAAFTQA
jgi:hypothetical protein